MLGVWDVHILTWPVSRTVKCHWRSFTGRWRELRSCEKVEVAVLGFPSLIVSMASVDSKQNWSTGRWITWTSNTEPAYVSIRWVGGLLRSYIEPCLPMGGWLLLDYKYWDWICQWVAGMDYEYRALITGCSLWTLSSLPTLMQKSFWWWQCSDRYIISLFPHLYTPFPPFSPSLISLMVSVDFKHDVYLLTGGYWLGLHVSRRGYRCVTDWFGLHVWNLAADWTTELRSCAKVEVAVLGSLSLPVLMVSVDGKKHWTWTWLDSGYAVPSMVSPLDERHRGLERPAGASAA